MALVQGTGRRRGPGRPRSQRRLLEARRGPPSGAGWSSLACVSRQHLEFRLKDERVAEAIQVLGVAAGSGAPVIAAARAIRLVAFAAP